MKRVIVVKKNTSTEEFPKDQTWKILLVTGKQEHVVSFARTRVLARRQAVVLRRQIKMFETMHTQGIKVNT